MLKQIKNQNLDKLKDLMNKFNQEYTIDIDNNINDIQDDESNMIDTVDTYQQSTSTNVNVSKGNIITAFVRKSNDEKKQETELNENDCSNGSIFILSSNKR
ncbi:hypothetical protein OCU04_007978 [Sclerotinia nivalis]|uniref:Uncharacterized protein n=1 Tax=Sclerotinia nivalis TaxID=352851 RepID=A0A9X0AKP4_9HELO|nr:hypothetical protein OCU04_007978 [Sclerotinia nivalis]